MFTLITPIITHTLIVFYLLLVVVSSNPTADKVHTRVRQAGPTYNNRPLNSQKSAEKHSAYNQETPTIIHGANEVHRLNLPEARLVNRQLPGRHSSRLEPENRQVNENPFSHLQSHKVNMDNLNNISFSLRHSWADRPPVSQEAKELTAMQSRCTQKYTTYPINNFGLGSGLQSFSKALCNSHNQGVSLYLQPVNWVWMDKEFCNKQGGQFSNPLECYFGKGIGASCDLSQLSKMEGQDWVRYHCPKYVVDDGDALAVFKFEGHFYEFLFSHVNPALVQLAEAEAKEVFGSKRSPENMITIHIRWGDKEKEMGGLIALDIYINAAYTLIQKHNIKDVHIFLSTESPKASKMFKEHPYVVEKKWKVYEYKNTISKTEGYTLANHANQGPIGLHNIISILLAMESRFYVLTSASNWSTIIAGLMNGVVNSDCNNCVDWIDLKFNRLFRTAFVDYNTKKRINRNESHYGTYPYNQQGMLMFPIDYKSSLLTYQ